MHRIGKLRWHSQNMNTQEYAGRLPKLGGMLREGRIWFNWGEDYRDLLRVEWHVPARFYHAELRLNDMEDRWQVALACGLFAVWVSGGNPAYPSKEQEYGVSLSDWTLRLKLGANPMEWSRDQPWWWENSLDLHKLIFGKTVYETRDLSEERVVVRMPEGDYPATVKMFESTWTPRRPLLGRLRRKRIVRADLKPDTPVPHPGKGENSWDQGEDAMFSLTCPATTASEAARIAAEAVMRDRIKYGSGYAWRPAAVGEEG
jgi:hypothetical protein